MIRAGTFDHDDDEDHEDHNVDDDVVLLHGVAPLPDQSWHLFDVAHELVVEELVEHHDDNSAEVHFAREGNKEQELPRN